MKARYSRETRRTLTPREQEIYDLLVSEGLRRLDMAERLGIKYGSMRRHMQNIYTKTGAESAVQLVVWHYTKKAGE